MSAAPKATSTGNAGRHQGKASTTASQKSPSRSPSRTAGRSALASNASTADNMSRTKSLRKNGVGPPASARAAVKKPTTGSYNATNANNGADAGAVMDDEGKEQTAAAVEDLQERLRTAESTVEESQKQNTVLQSRLDDAGNDQGRLEEQLDELSQGIEDRDNEQKEVTRQKRELENKYQAERSASERAQEEASTREEEQTVTIRRLKESLAHSGHRASPSVDPGLDHSSTASPSGAPSPNHRSTNFAPSSSHQLSESSHSSELLLEKDKMIESLRLELAEAHIKVVELESLGSGRVQDLENSLMETKVANAKLTEESESYQLLLSEKTLNGDLSAVDFLRSTSQARSGAPETHSNLADELDDTSETNNHTYKRYQAEIASLKDQNKALTTYINTIISRVMQHSGFESVLDMNTDTTSPAAAALSAAPGPVEKDLPPPPPEKDDSAAASLISRTRNMLAARPQPRPINSLWPRSEPPVAATTAHENPTTAPSIPIARSSHRSVSAGHRRTNSELNSAAHANNMPQGQSPNMSGRLSPNVRSPRNSFSTAPPTRPSGARVPSSSTIPTISENDYNGYRPNRDSKMSSSRESVTSDTSSPSSPPRSTSSGGEKAGGSVMMGSKPRPLRLVQEAAGQDEAAKKAANRTTWYGWFNKAAGDKAAS